MDSATAISQPLAHLIKLSLQTNIVISYKIFTHINIM